MPKDRSGLFKALPERMQQISKAVDEMNKVVTGGKFDPEQVWGAKATDNLTDYMTKLPIDEKLKAEVNKLLNGAPAPITSAIDKMVTGLKDVVKKLQDQVDAVGDDVTGRIEALKNLTEEHQPGDYSFADNHFGLIPALTGIITTAADTEPINVQEIIGPLNKLKEIVEAGQGTGYFIQYATTSIDLLQRAVNPNNKTLPAPKETPALPESTGDKATEKAVDKGTEKAAETTEKSSSKKSKTEPAEAEKEPTVVK